MRTLDTSVPALKECIDLEMPEKKSDCKGAVKKQKDTIKSGDGYSIHIADLYILSRKILILCP